MSLEDTGDDKQLTFNKVQKNMENKASTGHRRRLFGQKEGDLGQHGPGAFG